MSDEMIQETSNTLEPYQRPAVVHELDLETRAGSPLRINPIIDPLGIDPTAH